MSTNGGSEQDVRHHYTLVCQCEWSEDEFTRTTESRNCVIHGDEPDPLYALLAEVEQLRAALEGAISVAQWMSGSESFSPGGEAHDGWLRQREVLSAAMKVLEAVRG